MACSELFPGFYKINLPIPRGGFESFLDGWFIKDEARAQNILVETGPASAVPELFARRSKSSEIPGSTTSSTRTYISTTRAGAGHFIRRYPNTKLLAPAKGRPHLVDPSKLIAGSRTSLGSLCDVYGEPLPVPAENMLGDGGEIPGLTVIDTPGHAPHHSSYIYELGGAQDTLRGRGGGLLVPPRRRQLFHTPGDAAQVLLRHGDGFA